MHGNRHYIDIADEAYHESIALPDPSRRYRIFHTPASRSRRPRPHWHELMEIMAVTEGKGDMVVNGTTFPISSGEVVVIGGMDVHACNTTACGLLDLLVLQIVPSDWDEGLQERMMLSCQEGAVAGHLISGEAGRSICGFMRSIMEAGALQPSSSLAAKGYIYLVLAEILHSFDIRLKGSEREDMPSRLRDLTNILAEINASPAAAPSLSEAALRVSMSPSSFSRYFKHKIGKGFVEYIQEVRLQRTVSLLCTTRLPIGEIAAITGFNSLNYFNRLFLRRFGTTPTGYRASFRDKE